MSRNKACVLVLDNLRSVENTGSIFRTAEGLGVSKIILIGTTPTPLDRFGRKRADFAKVSLGAENLQWEYRKDIVETLGELKDQGFQIISLEQTGKSKNLTVFNAKEKFALVVGNEVSGVSKEALKLSDEIVEIPMEGKKESFNVSVSLGIALFVLKYPYA
jgi:23S rRNA (guanosine2251-2'-O)-methyltransferase